MTEWLNSLRWNSDGLLPAIAQDKDSGEVLMLAWMNREALRLSSERGRAVYWSRSRQKLWFKGEESGHVQPVSDCGTGRGRSMKKLSKILTRFIDE
jgi:phosphoribosyl-AMP cyclohydrolase